MTECLVLISAPNSQQVATCAGKEPPGAILAAGPNAQFVWDEFFAGSVRNPHTRRAYLRAVREFLDWIQPVGVTLTQVTPGLVGRYFDSLQSSVPSQKLALAALRTFFDALVLRHVLVLNPADSVRTVRYQVVEGRTPEIKIEEARSLLHSIDVSTRIGLRDRAVIGCLIYTAARAGAVAALRLRDFRLDGAQYLLRFAEKGGKQRDIPVRHDLEDFLREYLTAAGLTDAPTDSPLFRTANRRTGWLTDRRLTGLDIWRLVKRRLRAAGLPDHFRPHSFRVTTVTDLLEQGVPLGDVQYLAGHTDPRTTRLYDRRQKKVSRNLVERISV